MQFDIIIIGGSYAGLAAGLQLARDSCRGWRRAPQPVRERLARIFRP